MSVLPTSSWYQTQAVLHPLAVGGATLACVFVYMRSTSARSLNPNSLFSWMCSVALGSTVSRIITTPDINFVRGLLSLFIIFLAEYLSTYAASNVSKSFAFVFSNPPVLLVFRGEVDSAIMRKHRIAPSGLMQALRSSGNVRLSQVEAIILEANGSLSVIPLLEGKDRHGPLEALDNVPTYAKRCRELLGEHRYRDDEPNVHQLGGKVVQTIEKRTKEEGTTTATGGGERHSNQSDDRTMRELA